jgi:hypothetical protein
MSRRRVQALERLADFLQSASNVTVLTGAGVSTGSPTAEQLNRSPPAPHMMICSNIWRLCCGSRGLGPDCAESNIPDYRGARGAYSTGFKPMTHQQVCSVSWALADGCETQHRVRERAMAEGHG